MTQMQISIGSASAADARAFILAFQTTESEFGLPAQLTTEPTVRIAGVGWHVTTPQLTREHAAELMARFNGGHGEVT